jgi:branched-chain amino acid transport system permease protein
MLSAHLGWTEPLTSLLLATVISGVIGLLSGLVLLRYHGLTLLMLTMATAIFLQELANANDAWTGGFDGLEGISFQPLLGMFEYDLWGKTHYVYCAVVLLLVFLFCRRLVHSPFGQSLIGIRENTLRMHSVGTPVYRRLVTVYTISAAIAGLAGALFAQANTFVTLDVLDFSRSGVVLIMIILGGTGHLYGAFIGASLFLILEDELSKISPAFWEFGVGLLLVLVVLFGRGGVIGLFKRMRGTEPGSGQ